MKIQEILKSIKELDRTELQLLLEFTGKVIYAKGCEDYLNSIQMSGEYGPLTYKGDNPDESGFICVCSDKNSNNF